MITLFLELREHIELNGGDAEAIAPLSSLCFYDFVEVLDFSAKKKSKERNCKKGFPCGATCISKSRKCRKPLAGQAKTAQEWLKQTAGTSSPSASDNPDVSSQPVDDANPIKAPAEDSAPTLKAEKFNPHAKEDLQPDEFLEFLEERSFINQQDDPSQPFNQSYEDWKASTEDFDTRKSAYKSRVKEAIEFGGFSPSEAAIADAGLTKRESKKAKENKAELEKRRAKVDETQRAIDHPLMSDEDAEGYKPRMSKEEAIAYVGDSYLAGVDFYHGNSKGVTQSVQSDGVKPELNTTGIYGQGFYMGAAKEIGEDYAAASAAFDGAEVETMSMRVKAKNPFVVDTATLDSISAEFEDYGDKSNKELTEFVRAKGYDSIYIPDAGYMVALDGRQAVVYDSQEMASGDDSINAIKERQAGDSGSISDYVGYVGQTTHGQKLNELERSR